MNPIEFQACPGCTKCPLREGATHPGVPTRVSDFGRQGHDTALVVIGEAPGWEEDRDGKNWVGYSGKMLHGLLNIPRIQDKADIFLANVNRCRLPMGEDSTGTQRRICREYLEADLLAIMKEYPKVYILCAGAVAASTCGRKSLKEAYHYQGQHVRLFKDVRLPVFYTIHPANLAPSKDPNRKRQGGPALIATIQEHIMLLDRVLGGEQNIVEAEVTYTLAEAPPTNFPSLLCIDIETYGALKGVEQTVFHPVKSEKVDGIPPDQQIATVAIGWEDDAGEHATVFVWGRPAHKAMLYRWLTTAARRHSTLFNANLVFDLLYLRHCSDYLKKVLTIGGVHLDDIQLINHLQYELRPERALKPLSELFGVVNYAGLEVNAHVESKRASSAESAGLHLYNATDVIAPLRLRRLLFTRIRQQYGENSPKLGPLCESFRDEMLWSVLHMAEAGLAMDRPAVEAVDAKYRALTEACEKTAREQHNLILSGAGSDASKRDAIMTALQAHLTDPRVQFTKKTRKIAFGKDNVNLALTLCSKDNPARVLVELMQDYSKNAYVVSHYTNKLLGETAEDRQKPQREGFVDGSLCYPSWYLVPSAFTKDADPDDDTGGTIQGRITCSGPAAQTFPYLLKDCIVSIWPGGSILAADESQLELRVAGLRSGDPVLCVAYREGRDLHSEMAIRLFPHVTPDNPLWKKVYRHVGKRSNFLMIYLGGARRLQDTLRKDIGHIVDVDTVLPLAECERIINEQHRVYHVYFEHHEAQVREVVRKQYLELPTGWGRTFVGSYRDVKMTYDKEISNCPIQTLAAQLVLSAQYAITTELLRRGLKSVIRLNVYDALVLDCYPGEEAQVREIIAGPLTRPPLLPIIEQAVGRSVPLAYELRRKGPGDAKFVETAA